MSLGVTHSFEFGDEIPIDAVEGGNSILVTGPADAGLDSLVHELLSVDDEEALVAVTTEKDGRRFRKAQERASGELADDSVRIVDCDGDSSYDDTVVPVSGPEDLTDINVQLSSLSDDLQYDGAEAVRTGVYSALPMVAAAEDMRDIYRFLQNSISRTRRNGGLFVCGLDPDGDVGEMGDGNHIVTGLSKAFQGQVELRGDRRNAEVRVTGIDGSDGEWHPVDL